MASVYPGALDSLDTTIVNTDATENHHPQHHIDLADAVNKIEAELGINPSGTFADVAVRLAARQDVRKTADQASTSTTLADVTELVFPVAATTRYSFSFNLVYRTAATTTGIGLALTVPTGFTVFSYGVQIFGLAADGASASFHGAGTSSDDLVLSTAVVAANTDYVATIHGSLVTGATTGNLQLRFRTEISGSAATIRNGSYANLYVE